MPQRIFKLDKPLIRLEMECVVGQINTEVVNNQIPVILERMHKLIKEMHDANINKKEFMFAQQTSSLLELSAKLLFIGEQRLEEIAEDKVKYAPHPTFIPD